MKKSILILFVIVASNFTSCKTETKTNSTENTNVSNSKEIALVETSFGVRGNCGMCKNTIEKAAKAIEGVEIADWDRNKKSISVSFDESKTDELKIHNAIAASGYDTEKVLGDLNAYEGLPECCKYDHEMEMNQSGEVTSDDHGH